MAGVLAPSSSSSLSLGGWCGVWSPGGGGRLGWESRHTDRPPRGGFVSEASHEVLKRHGVGLVHMRAFARKFRVWCGGWRGEAQARFRALPLKRHYCGNHLRPRRPDHLSTTTANRTTTGAGEHLHVERRLGTARGGVVHLYVQFVSCSWCPSHLSARIRSPYCLVYPPTPSIRLQPLSPLSILSAYTSGAHRLQVKSTYSHRHPYEHRHPHPTQRSTRAHTMAQHIPARASSVPAQR